METKLKRIMASLFGIEESRITEKTSTVSVVEWDSLRHIELVIAVEEEFAVSLSADEVAEMVTFQKIISILQKHQVSNLDRETCTSP